MLFLQQVSERLEFELRDAHLDQLAFHLWLQLLYCLLKIEPENACTMTMVCLVSCIVESHLVLPKGSPAQTQHHGQQPEL